MDDWSGERWVNDVDLASPLEMYDAAWRVQLLDWGLCLGRSLPPGQCEG